MANDEEVNSKIVHWVGPVTHIATRVRQRCMWCGAALIDVDLTTIMVAIPPGKTEDEAREEGSLEMATWEPGSWIAVDRGVTSVERTVEEDQTHNETPEHSCARLDFEITG